MCTKRMDSVQSEDYDQCRAKRQWSVAFEEAVAALVEAAVVSSE